jgi:hypothetical protein
MLENLKILIFDGRLALFLYLVDEVNKYNKEGKCRSFAQGSG